MRLTTEDLEAAPVVMIVALARDDEWHIEVYDDDDTLIVAGVVLPDSDHRSLIVEPFDYTTNTTAGEPVTLDWDAVERLHVP